MMFSESVGSGACLSGLSGAGDGFRGGVVDGPGQDALPSDGRPR